LPTGAPQSHEQPLLLEVRKCRHPNGRPRPDWADRALARALPAGLQPNTGRRPPSVRSTTGAGC